MFGIRFAAFAGFVVAGGFAASALADDVVLPDGKAKTIIEGACVDCHGLDQVVSNPMSSAEWRKTVTRMVKKGAALSPDQIDTVVEYLSVYFVPDKVNVNTASAQDLQNGLRLTAVEADAVVKYRAANGAFKDFEGLRKVIGVDQKKLEAVKDQVAF